MIWFAFEQGFQGLCLGLHRGLQSGFNIFINRNILYFRMFVLAALDDRFVRQTSAFGIQFGCGTMTIFCYDYLQH